MDGTDTPEASPEAAAILAGAGWKPHDEWHVFTRGTLVMGFDPLGTGFHVKNTARMPDGPDTPDDPIAAARWLVARFPANPLSSEATLETPAVAGEAASYTDEEFATLPELQYDTAHETHGETGEEAQPEVGPILAAEAGGAPEDVDVSRPAGNDDPTGEWFGDGSEPRRHAAGDVAVFDADFGDPEPDSLDLGEIEDYVRDPLLLEGDEPEAPATEEPGGSQFIFGDNLEQMRTAAIGLVMRHARTLMPFWTTNEDIALTELRNYVLGVKENGWPDIPERRDDLDALEKKLSRIGDVTKARDAKVEFLESASREEIEAFDATDGWP